MGDKRDKSEELCRVEELCDHLKDMKFEDVHKIEENSKVCKQQRRGALLTKTVTRKLVTISDMKICPMMTSLSTTCSV